MSYDRTRHKSRHRGIYYRLDAREKRRWVVWYTDSDGKGRYETLPEGSTEKDALARRAELSTRKARGERVAPSKITLKELVDRWLEIQRGRLKPKTVVGYESALRVHVLPKLGRRKVQDITIGDIAGLVSSMQREKKKAWTIRGTLTPLSRVMAFAVREGLAPTNPVRGLDRTERPKGDQKKMRILGRDEIQKVLEHAPKPYSALLATAVFTGMRRGELLRLRWEDVDFTTGIITIGQSKTLAGEDRRIVLIPALAGVLKRHKLSSAFSGPSELVFCTGKGTPMGERNVARRGLDKALERAGVEHIRFHDLRHTYASILIGQGEDVTFVADQMGHADPQITLRTYAKLFEPQARRDGARDKLEAAFGEMLQ